MMEDNTRPPLDKIHQIDGRGPGLTLGKCDKDVHADKVVQPVAQVEPGVRLQELNVGVDDVQPGVQDHAEPDQSGQDCLHG